MTAVADVTSRTVRLTLAGVDLGADPLDPTRWVKLTPATRLTAGAAVTRAYTVRAYRRLQQEVDVDVVLHGDGPMAAWAAHAREGDEVGVGEPRGRFEVPAEVGWWLLVADESAQPAVATILATLPADAVGVALLATARAGDAQPLAAPPGVEVRWSSGAEPGSVLAAAVAAQPLPEGEVCAWVAAEAGAVRTVHVGLAARGLSRHQLRTKGYWKLGQADLRA